MGEFYGQSYFCDPRGQIITEGPRDDDALVVANLNLDMIDEVRSTWQFYRDRRPDAYGRPGGAMTTTSTKPETGTPAAVETYKNFVGGEWIASSSTRTVDNVNPADTRDVLGRVALSTKDEALQAVAAAKAAFPAWRDTPAPVRGKVIAGAAALLTEEKEQMARLLTREEGKAFKDSLGEVQRTINILEYIAGEGRRLGGQTVASELPSNFCYTLRVPVGVVACITPWNFPVAIPLWKIAPALVAGNTVVFKPATLTPATGVACCELLERAGLPKGVLNMVLGSGSQIGNAILDSGDIQAVSFTGSNEVGSDIYGRGAQGMMRVQCEMGGKNPIVVLADADLDLAVAATVHGAFASTGQRCTATSRAIVEESIADEFVKRLAAEAEKLVVGDGSKDAFMGPAVDENQLKTDLEYIEIGKKEGAKLVTGGRRLEDGDHAHGYFIAPTVFDGVTRSMRIAQEEIFGPVISVIRVKDFDAAVEAANDVKFGLASAIFSRDIGNCHRFIDQSDVGIVHINSGTPGGEAHLPFGGSKATGVGPREQGHTALEFFTEVKTVYVDYTGGLTEDERLLIV